MIKVMLINPPQTYFSQSAGFSVYFPLSLLSVATVIKDICKVKIFDCLVTDFEVKKIKDFTLFGTPIEKIKSAIEDFNPDITGISIPFSAQLENAVIVSRICKEINPEMTVVFGGPHASVGYKSLLKEGLCDFCVVGEGEKTFFELVKKTNSKSSLKGIEGLASKGGDNICYKPRKFIEDLDELPLPAYELINVEDYLKSPYLYINRSRIHKNSISIITSRGCPYNCVFCSIRLHMGQKFRYHSPGYVIQHLKFLIERYGITNFHFEDDNISFNRARFEQILDEIIDKGLKIRWDTPNGVRADTLNFDLLKKIKRSGCKELTIAIESGNQHVLDYIIKKKTSLDKMLNVVKYCKELRIKISAFYVIGFPGETIKNMKETINLALKLFRSYDVIPCLYVATPLYGTELYDICIEKDIIKENMTGKDFSTATQIYGEPMIYTEDFSKDDIKNLLHCYKGGYKKELIIYYIKHPFHALEIVRNKPALIKRFLKLLLR